MTKALKVLFATFVLLLIAVVSSMAQSVEILADSTVVVHIPPTLVIPDFTKPGWAQSTEFLALVSSIVTVILGFLAQLVPKWRNMNLGMVSKISILAVISVAFVFTLGGKAAWPAIVQLILGSIMTQSHIIYSAVAKPLVGSTTGAESAPAKKSK